MAREGAQRRIERPAGDDCVVLHARRAQVRITAPEDHDCVVVHVEARIARAATLQDGVMSRDELVAAGLGRGAIRHRVETGEFTRLFRGVYAIGRTAVSPRGWVRAALLAIGPDATFSHRTAAYIWASPTRRRRCT